MPNLNYPNYSQGFGGYSRSQQPSYQPQAPMPSGGGLQDFLNIASPVASIAGIGLGAYGMYKQNQAIEEQNRLAREIFEDERRRAIERDDQIRESELLNRDIGYGRYAQGEEDRVMSGFGGYASRVGL